LVQRFRGKDLNVILHQHVPSLHNRYKSAERKISQKNPKSLLEWSLDGPLPQLCPVIPIANHDGRQAKNRKKGMQI
jgi:hypothetical protein